MLHFFSGAKVRNVGRLKRTKVTCSKLLSLSQQPELCPCEIVPFCGLKGIVLNPIEEALAYKKLLNEFHLKQDEVAERVSKSRTAVTNSMRLLKLDERVQQMVIDDLISTGHARPLLAIPDNEDQYNLAQQIFDEKLSVRETEKLVKKFQKQKSELPKKQEDDGMSVFYEDMEQKLKAIMGTKVAIHYKNKDKGKIEIEYYSNNELERILELFQSIHQIDT